MDYNGWECVNLIQITIRTTIVVRNGVDLIVTRVSEMQYLHAVSKMTEWSVCFQGKSFNILVIQLCAPITNVEEAEPERF